MKRRPHIHLADAAQAAQGGLWVDAIGHCAAAEAAGAARPEIEAALRPALAEGLTALEALSPAQCACLLAIQAVASQDAARVADLTSFLAENATSLSTAEIVTTDSLADVSRRFDRLAAIGLMNGLTEKDARKRAAEDVIATLDALVAKNPSGWEARARRTRALLDLDRFSDAIKDLRYLAKIDLPDPFVHTNLITCLRRLSHPEVVAAVGALMAVMPQTPEEFERWRHALIGMNATPQAFALLEKLIPHKPEYALIKHLRDMADDLDQRPATEFGRAPSGRHLLYASMVCWGAKYLALMDRASFASLLSPGNFPALCAEHDVVLDLFTMAEDIDQILAMPSLQALASHCQIRLFVFPREIARHRQHFGSFSNQFFGFGSAFTIQRAKRDGADLLFLIPDVVYADGSFAYVASIVTKAPRALMADGLNTMADSMLKALEPYRGQHEPSLTISIQDLIDISAPRLMTRTTRHFFDPDAGQASSYPQRVIFCEADGLVVHMFYKSPAYVSHAAIKLFGPLNYGTPNSSVTGALLDLLPKKDILPQDGELKYLMIELGDDEGRTQAKTQKTLLESIRNLFLNYAFHLNSLDEFAIGVRYPTRVAYADRLTTPAEREAFLAALTEERRTHPLYTELCMERDKHSPALQLGKSA